MTESLDEFAVSLVKLVRDRAIQSCDRALLSTRSPVGKRWKSLEGSENLRRAMIVDCVDETLFWLLQSIDQGELKLSFTSSRSVTLNLCEDGDGELSGWYMGSGGWRSQYSTQRFHDDFDDLT